MKNYYYGIATSQNGTGRILPSLTSEDRLGAENEAKSQCKKEGLIFNYVKPNNNTVKGGSTLTKNKRARDLKAASKKR